MAIEYFLLVGDKTTCGGQIITGDQTMTFNGRATARKGDKVTCAPVVPSSLIRRWAVMKNRSSLISRPPRRLIWRR
ncbi:hypothetical protein AM629_17475 [Photorhabdus heterorhabditis]|uniref:PAAR domain-containing protein n=1 Tax=Photorhabdus heterorhabditis TaxID=880156 RepID=A0ABR5K843_9GAMM|nr:hypothetical protein AM629_17475 [Photorhabdus heterorhabditis]